MKVSWFDLVLDTFALEENELASSLITAVFEDVKQSYYIVGTGFSLPDEDEPTRGRLLVFSVQGSRLYLEQSFEIQGCAFSLVNVHGYLIAAVNSKVVALKNTTSGLEPVSTHHGHVIALSLASKGDYIVVADLIKSVTLLKFDVTSEKLIEMARDHETNWMTAIEVLDQDIILGGENHYNLFGLKYSPSNEASSASLDNYGSFHLGDIVNKFSKGTTYSPRFLENEVARSNLYHHPSTLVLHCGWLYWYRIDLDGGCVCRL